MRNAFLFIAGATISGLVVFMGCGGGGGGTTGTGGKSTSHTTAASTGSMGPHSSSSASATGSGGSMTCMPDGGGGAAAVGNHCNPVTNTGCPTGSSCDYDLNCAGNTIGFSCTSQATVTTCGDCSTMPCGPGTTCFYTDTSMTTSVCARYCCTNADCGSSGKCDTGGMMPYFGPDAPQVGICVLLSPPDGGATGDFVCSPPATPPSGGSCITTI
jgi:hypothetical protein